MKTKYIIFDLDDTLFYEIDFLKSAYQEIAKTILRENFHELFNKMVKLYHQGQNVFDYLVDNSKDLSKNELLEIYRNHFPFIQLNKGVKEIFDYCVSKKYKLGLITDGRSITQRNKLKALKIESVFNKIIISEEFGSEKPNKDNYLIFEEEDVTEYYYIGDNIKKDFITPNQIGWRTICLKDKGSNIHCQNFDLDKIYLPQQIIENIIEIKNII